MKASSLYLLLVSLLLTQAAAGRDCVLPTGQRFQVDIVECAHLVPGAVEATPPLPSRPSPSDWRGAGAQDKRLPEPARAAPRPSVQRRPFEPAGTMTYVTGAGGRCYAINQQGYAAPVEPKRCGP